MATIPTVEIDRGGHKLTINESDFDPSRDVLWGEKSEPAITDGEAPQSSVDADEIDQVAIEARLAELQGLAKDWRKIKPIAEFHGITEKPDDGWDAAVLPILVAEYGQTAVDEVTADDT